MGKQFNNGIWSAVQFLVCSHNETELAKQVIEETGLTKKDCLKSQMESDFESETMLEFINSVFPVVDDKHCSQCKHYEICTNFTMYCRMLQKRITARKKPCKHYKMRNGV